MEIPGTREPKAILGPRDIRDKKATLGKLVILALKGIPDLVEKRDTPEKLDIPVPKVIREYKEPLVIRVKEPPDTQVFKAQRDIRG